MAGMSSRIIRFADLPVSRWANGLGETVELWRDPVDGAFDVRLSIATVDTAGPFSVLPGVDRALLPLARDGLTVRVDADIHRSRQYETLCFSGDADAASQDVRETGRDLNLMVRRGVGRPVLSAVRVGDGVDAITVGRRDNRAIAVVVLDGAPTLGEDALSFGDAVILGDVAARIAGRGLVAVARLA